MEQTQDPLEYDVVLLPGASELPKAVKMRDLEVLGKAELIFAEHVVYPPNATLHSYPTHVRGLFIASARLKAESGANEAAETNYFVSKAFKKRFRGPVVAAYCVVPAYPGNSVVEADVNQDVAQDMSLERFAELESHFKLRSPGLDFIEKELAASPSYCRLDHYLRPFLAPMPDGKWKWSPKQAVAKLFVQLKRSPRYVEAGPKDLGDAVFQHTRTAKQFYSKLEIWHTDENSVEHIGSVSYVPQNGPFTTKLDSEVAAAITFLSEYHDATIQARNPVLYHLRQQLLGEAAPEPALDDSNGSDPSSSLPEFEIDSSVPLDIKRPTLGIWERISAISKVDLFGNGCLIKSIISEGNGPLLGISCKVRAWIAVLMEEDDGMHALISSKLDNMVIGATHSFLPLAALASMRVGESAYFWLHPSIARLSDPSQAEEQLPVIVALCIPSNAIIQDYTPSLANSDINTPFEYRVARCQECDRDAVLLYKQLQFKLALDHYQLGLLELSTSNEMFVSRSRTLRADIEWNEVLGGMKAAFIRNRLGAAACCLYLNEWPQQAPSCRYAQSVLEEGLEACDSIIRLEPQHFLAHRRKLLLLIGANRFEDAQTQLLQVESLEPAHEEANQRAIKLAKDDLVLRIQRAAQETSSVAKRMFQ